jgi:hypothetical protein
MFILFIITYTYCLATEMDNNITVYENSDCIVLVKDDNHICTTINKTDIENKSGEPFDAIFFLKGILILGILIIGGLTSKRIITNSNMNSFDNNSVRLLSIIFFLPVLIILGLLGIFDSTALAALLGTVAGYILSGLNEKK